jgi:GT2 family glycosyltransferase
MSVGKFPLHRGSRFLVKGVSYGTFEPDSDGLQFPPSRRVAGDFAMMAEAGINTVRIYTPPPLSLLDEAARHGLKVMVGLPWPQDVAFLDDPALCRQIRRDVDREVRRLAGHEALLMIAVGNEVPSSIVRWHGRERFERFLGDLYGTAKSAAPEQLVTYVNYPPTDYLELPFLDVVAFNVYLHRENELRAYLARLHHVAGNRPLLLAEAGADAHRNGEERQASLTAMQLRAAFEEGAWGAIAFNWTDEWWRGGHSIEDWSFGLVDRHRRPKLALGAVSRVFAHAPFPQEQRRTWPKVSVVVCVHNAAASLAGCLSAAEQLEYPDFEVLVIDDGSTDDTPVIAGRYDRVRLIRVPHGGLSAARNVGMTQACGEIVAYLDGDARPDPDWLSYLVQPFISSTVAAAGGPNVVPADDPWFSQCVARAPGGPQHVLLDDRIAEHVPGCNMAFRREALLALDGFNPSFVRAGDDVDLCWRLQARGWEIGFAPAALVWHEHRASLRSYWRQQVGYGESEAWLKPLHPGKFMGRSPIWHGHIYSALPFVRALRRSRINTGVWGSAAFPSVYRFGGRSFAYLPHSGRWQVASIGILASSLGMLFTPFHPFAVPLGMAGLVAIAITLIKCFGYALKTDIEALPGVTRAPLRRLLYRTVLAVLHFVQPLARTYGRVRGYLLPPKTCRSSVRQSAESPKSSQTRPQVGSAIRSLRLLTGASIQTKFWSEQRVSVELVLAKLTDWLRRSRAVDMIELDDGWRSDRDLRVSIGSLVCFDLRAVVEDHGSGKCLLRIATRARPTRLGGFLAGVAGVAALIAGVGALVSSPGITIIGLSIIAFAVPAGVWPVVKTASVVREAIAKVMKEMQTTPLSSRADSRRVHQARQDRAAEPTTPIGHVRAPVKSPDRALTTVSRLETASTASRPDTDQWR